MIFYFTGTGNSLWVAKQLSNLLNETLYSITKELNNNKPKLEFSLKNEEKVIFVYPIHTWGPPSIVLDFIDRLVFNDYNNQSIYSVCTCGDDCGYTTEILNKSLKKRGFNLSGSYSVIMPNNYILLPGFEVDSKSEEERKLHEASSRIQAIVNAIDNKDKGQSLYKEGTIPFIKSYIINPLFIKFDLGRNSFYTTDACISCGLCAKICPSNTISMVNKKPKWGKTCLQCMACIHRCPVRAIEHGKITKKKGRYIHPDLTTQ